MTDRRRHMGRLFACLAERGIGEDQRHAWASGALNRDVASFTSLTIAEIDELTSATERRGDGDEYVMCGALGPDDLPCVLHEGHGHNGDGEYECVDESGRMWVLR